MAYVTLSSKAIGSTIKLKVNGSAKDFIVVHQGKPSSVYDDKPCFTIELVEDDDGCLIYAKDEHGDTLNFEIVECVGLPRLNTPIDEAIKMMAYSIINTAHECY